MSALAFVDWDWENWGEWGGDMQYGHGLNTEMEPIELGERVEGALLMDLWASIYSSTEDRSQAHERLILARIATRDVGFVRRYINQKYPEASA